MDFLFLTGLHICITCSLLWARHNKRAMSSKWWGKKRPSVALINSLVEQTGSYIQFTCKDWTVTLLLSWPTCGAQKRNYFWSPQVLVLPQLRYWEWAAKGKWRRASSPVLLETWWHYVEWEWSLSHVSVPPNTMHYKFSHVWLSLLFSF